MNFRFKDLDKYDNLLIKIVEFKRLDEGPDEMKKPDNIILDSNSDNRI